MLIGFRRSHGSYKDKNSARVSSINLLGFHGLDSLSSSSPSISLPRLRQLFGSLRIPLLEVGSIEEEEMEPETGKSPIILRKERRYFRRCGGCGESP